jgi:PKHD-type hydroxylase
LKDLKMNRKELLDKNNYVFLESFISVEEASELAKQFAEAEKDKQTFAEPGHEESASIYNFIPFVKLLTKKLPDVSLICGEDVLPTYSYARIYKKGATLPRHTDRDECEVSVTVNLSQDQIWHLCVEKPDGEHITAHLNPGDAIMYKGCDAPHWRQGEFTGNTYTQLFLHYVKANGSRANVYFDNKKKKIEREVSQKVAGIYPFQRDETEDWAYFDRLFSPLECQQIIAMSSGFGEGLLTDKKVANKSIRDSDVNFLYPCEENGWVFERIAHTVKKLNQQYFGFNLFGLSEGLQLTKYNSPGGKYIRHIDRGMGHEVRKLSVTIQLSDPSEYEGGELVLHYDHEPTVMSKDQGRLIVFPSYVLHEVKPVTKGTRYSLVAWVTGEPFK